MRFEIWKELRERTKRFALDVIRLVKDLPQTLEAKVIGRQLLRSATSIAANYRATTRARSRAEWMSKVAVVVEEADETVLWIELLRDAGIAPEARVRSLSAEADQLLRIFAATRRTSQRNSSKRVLQSADHKSQISHLK